MTNVLETDISVDTLAGGEDFALTLTRGTFEQIIDPLLERCFVPLEKVMMDSGLAKNEIDEVILVGGSTRIPLV